MGSRADGHLLFEALWVVTIVGVVAWRRHGLPAGGVRRGLLLVLLMPQVASPLESTQRRIQGAGRLTPG